MLENVDAYKKHNSYACRVYIHNFIVSVKA